MAFPSRSCATARNSAVTRPSVVDGGQSMGADRPLSSSSDGASKYPALLAVRGKPGSGGGATVMTCILRDRTNESIPRREIAGGGGQCIPSALAMVLVEYVPPRM